MCPCVDTGLRAVRLDLKKGGISVVEAGMPSSMSVLFFVEWKKQEAEPAGTNT